MVRGFSSSSPYAFGSTSPRLKKQPPVEADRLLTKAYMKNHTATAPKVSEMRVQREGAMAEDIGVLQDTIEVLELHVEVAQEQGHGDVLVSYALP
jgi:hypothetical protein